MEEKYSVLQYQQYDITVYTVIIIAQKYSQ